MHRTSFFLTVVGLAVFGLAMYGCTTSQPTESPTTPASQGSDTTDDVHADHGNHEGHDHDGEVGASDMDKMKAELAKLPESDRLAAEKQHMCPVSGEMLGTMGVPLKVTVKNQDVWLCCEGCKDQLLENPDEYLAKLNK